jgi:uncharacterized protein YdeI (YjbR/CyaY-like superfamily)
MGIQGIFLSISRVFKCGKKTIHNEKKPEYRYYPILIFKLTITDFHLPTEVNLSVFNGFDIIQQTHVIQTGNFDQVEITSSTELREWLLKNHAQVESIWLVTFKKSVQDKYVSRWEVLDELLCFGWIDGIRRKLDDDRTMQLISPRRVEHWSKTYKDRVSVLIENNRMHKAGLRSIKDSKQNGMWDFMNDVDALIIPTDLSDALKNRKGAKPFFDSINDSSKRFVLRWIKLAKTSKTRQSRITKITELSAKGEKLPGS